MSEVRINLYQADREFQLEISADGNGYRLFGPKFDGSSHLIRSAILSDRDKEEIIGLIKPTAKAIEEEVDRLINICKDRNAEITTLQVERDRLKVENQQLHDVCQEEMKSLKDTALEEIKKLKAELAEARREIERMRDALDTIEGMATDTTFDIQGVAKAALGGKEGEAVKDSSAIIEDGFGSSWSAFCPMCGFKTMQVVRPGKVQCSFCG